MTKNEERVLEIISKASRYNRASRDFIVRLTGISDREVRSIIESLRNQGYWICFGYDVKGYFLAANEHDKHEFATLFKAPAVRVLSTLSKLEGTADNQIALNIAKNYEEFMGVRNV